MVAASRLTPQHEKTLHERFPNLSDVLAANDAGGYEYRAISIFDEWLGRDRLNELDVNSEAEFVSRSRPLWRFNELVLNSTAAIAIGLDGMSNDGPPALFSFPSTKEALNYTNRSSWDLESSDFFRLLLPDFQAIYLESWDFTNVVYLRDLSSLQRIKDFAKDANVFVLTKNW